MLKKLCFYQFLGLTAMLFTLSCSSDFNLENSDPQETIELNQGNVLAIVAGARTSPAQLYVNTVGNDMHGYVCIDYIDDFRDDIHLSVIGFSDDADITAIVINPRLVEIHTATFQGSCIMNCVLAEGDSTTSFSVPITVVSGNPAMSMNIGFTPLTALADTIIIGDSNIEVNVDDFDISSIGLGNLEFAPVTNLDYDVDGSIYTFYTGLNPGPAYLGFTITNSLETAGVTQVTSTAVMTNLTVQNDVSGHVIVADGGNLNGAVARLSTNGNVMYTSDVRQVNGEWRFDFPDVGSLSYQCEVWLDSSSNNLVDVGDYYGFSVNSGWSEIAVSENDQDVVVVVYPLKASN
jgi:hypothetical protein